VDFRRREDFLSVYSPGSLMRQIRKGWHSGLLDSDLNAGWGKGNLDGRTVFVEMAMNCHDGR
jgi:hypothetical protein